MKTPVQEYLELRDALLFLRALNNDAESPEEDAILDEMERLWYKKMSQEDIAQIEKLCQPAPREEYRPVPEKDLPGAWPEGTILTTRLGDQDTRVRVLGAFRWQELMYIVQWLDLPRPVGILPAANTSPQLSTP